MFLERGPNTLFPAVLYHLFLVDWLIKPDRKEADASGRAT